MNATLAQRQKLPGQWAALLVAALVVALAFVFVAAVPYFRGDMEKLARYDGKRAWLLTHIAFGTVALLIGPFQLWLGFTRPRDLFHRRLGMIYLGMISISCVAAYYLAFHTEISFTFGFGLAGLATAWVITCSMAMLAIKRRQFLQHQEWMVRSYVVTFGFVFFRLLLVILGALNVGTIIERLTAASWFCWAAPLLMCEAVLQGRKFGRP